MRAAVVATVICISIISISAAQETAAAIKVATDIPPQPLEKALREFAQSRNLQVLYFSQTVGRMRTGGASGELTTDEALEQLLSGTGLTYRYVSDNDITILTTSGPDSASTATANSSSLFPGTEGGKHEGEKDTSRDFLRVVRTQAVTLQTSTVEKLAECRSNWT